MAEEVKPVSRLDISKPHLWYTLGPATLDVAQMRGALAAGATGARLTLSYGDHDYHIARAKELRRVALEGNADFLILADTPGEKVRLGDLGGHPTAPVKQGELWEFVPPGRKTDLDLKQIELKSNRVFGRVQKSDILVVGDGSASFEVQTANREAISGRAVADGVLNPNRGIVVRSRGFVPEALMPADEAHLQFLEKSNLADAVLLSFSNDASDIVRARRLCPSVPIIAKIETTRGVHNAHAIARQADGIMIARGDLALYHPWQKLGIATNAIVRAAESEGKPWFIATQIVEGLERFDTPTRAEVSDITQWTARGTSGFLLAYETAFGKQPIASIRCTREIIEAVIRGEE